jgi:hypothetical protein
MMDVLYPVVKTYNQTNVHSATKTTPQDAMKPSNQLQVRANAKIKSKHTIIHPDVHVGDYVKPNTKKHKMDQERLPPWSKDKFEVESINASMWQDFYKLEGRPRDLMRFEILRVN